MDWYWYIPIAIVVLVAIFGFIGWKARRAQSVEALQAAFRADRKRLEELFFNTAAASGKPRGLRWTKCEWNDMVAWVREKATGRLHALAGVTISFEAIEGGDMEGVAAVGNLRNATAVFYFDGEWRTAGRVVFNLNPDEAVVHFKDGYEQIV